MKIALYIAIILSSLISVGLHFIPLGLGTKILSYLIPIISFTIILTPIIDLIGSKITKHNSLLSSLLYALLVDDSNYSLLSSSLNVSNKPQSTTAKS
jgi:hypothetical protein